MEYIKLIYSYFYVIIQSESQSILQDKNDFILFLELLEIAFLDILNFKEDYDINYQEHKELFSSLSAKIERIEEKLSTIMLFKGCTSVNANVKLLVYKFSCKIYNYNRFLCKEG